MKNEIVLYEFYGEEEILNKLVGMTIKNVDCVNTETFENIISIDLEDKQGNKRYLSFTDGCWHYGEKKGFNIIKALKKPLEELNRICDESTSYWIHDGVLWCGEDADGGKGKVCDVDGIETFTVYSDGCIKLEGEKLNENWILRPYGPEF